MSDYLVYHNTESNQHSLIDDKSRRYRFDIYTTKNVKQLVGNTVWIIQGMYELGNKKKSYYLCEKFTVHNIGRKNSMNYAYGKEGDGDRYIGSNKILLNAFSWFPDFQHRMANFSLGLMKLNEADRTNFLMAINKKSAAKEPSISSMEIEKSITRTQIVAAYTVASDVFDGKLRPIDGIEVLHNQHGLNRSSARDFISQFRALMQGKIFKRTLSAAAIEHFLSQILLQRGRDSAQLALSAASQHVDYYEQIQGSKQRSFRSALDTFKQSLMSNFSASDIEKDLSNSLAQSLSDNSTSRRLRLRNAKKTPLAVFATVKLFIRNADVIAEVLTRSKGICELCGKHAPFNRRSDGTPYLEVHHRVKLADGGEDTVENAFALCPNCHRKEHYG